MICKPDKFYLVDVGSFMLNYQIFIILFYQLIILGFLNDEQLMDIFENEKPLKLNTWFFFQLKLNAKISIKHVIIYVYRVKPNVSFFSIQFKMFSV